MSEWFMNENKQLATVYQSFRGCAVTSSLDSTRRDLIRPAGGSSMDQFEASTDSYSSSSAATLPKQASRELATSIGLNCLLLLDKAIVIPHCTWHDDAMKKPTKIDSELVPSENDAYTNLFPNLQHGSDIKDSFHCQKIKDFLH